MLDRLFQKNGFGLAARILDCACGIGTQASKFECEYRATRRDELTSLLRSAGCSSVEWLFPQETGFYQPIVIAKK